MTDEIELRWHDFDGLQYVARGDEDSMLFLHDMLIENPEVHNVNWIALDET